MKATTFLFALVAAVEAQKRGEQRPIEPPLPNDPKSQGCYKSMGDWKEFAVENMSMGSCTDKCISEKFNASGLGGAKCYCGNNYPPEEDLVDDENCNYPCPSFPLEACKYRHAQTQVSEPSLTKALYRRWSLIRRLLFSIQQWPRHGRPTQGSGKGQRLKLEARRR